MLSHDILLRHVGDVDICWSSLSPGCGQLFPMLSYKPRMLGSCQLISVHGHPCILFTPMTRMKLVSHNRPLPLKGRQAVQANSQTQISRSNLQHTTAHPNDTHETRVSQPPAAIQRLQSRPGRLANTNQPVESATHHSTQTRPPYYHISRQELLCQTVL